MLDSGTKHPENRIHLYDPVGLITDGYAGYRPSNLTVRPRRQTVSYDNFLESTNINQNSGQKSYKTVSDAHSTGGLRSFDSFEVDSFTLSTFNEPIINSEKSNNDSGSTTAEDRTDGGLRFVVVGDDGVQDDQLDAPTPRLWRSTTPTSPKSINSDNTQNSNNHNHQNARTQAIAKGRRELMDMVRDLPEAFYELTLKDIVETKKQETDIPEEKKAVKLEKSEKETKKKQKISSKKVKKSESKRKMVRSKSVDNGKFLIKTSVFPILGSRKSKKSMNGSKSFKATTMAKTGETSNGSVKGWRRKSCMSSESDGSNGLSSQSTSRSSSSSSRSSNGTRRHSRFLGSCCIFNGRRIEGKG